MPTHANSKIPPPKDWSEFEDIVADVAKLKWNNPNVSRYGRSGQKQNGVDIVGESFHVQNGFVGVQCKNSDVDLSVALVEEEIKKAESFEPAIREFVLACTSKRDVSLHSEVMKISQLRKQSGKFPVVIWFWDDLLLELAGDRVLMEKHYPQFVKSSITHDRVMKMIQGSVPSDWEYEDSEGVFTYKPDVNLTIRDLETDFDNIFPEPWSKKFPDQNGRSIIYNIFYGSSFIKKEYLVGVDGFRGYIPYPEDGYSDNPKLNKWKYKIGEIIHSKLGFGPPIYSYDRMLARANISVVED